MASVTLLNTHKDKKRAKSERPFTTKFLLFKLLLGYGLDCEFGLGLRLDLELGLEFGFVFFGVRARIVIFLFLCNIIAVSAFNILYYLR